MCFAIRIKRASKQKEPPPAAALHFVVFILTMHISSTLFGCKLSLLVGGYGGTALNGNVTER